MENPNIQVVAFELSSGPLDFLKENPRINNFNNIEEEDIALSEKNGSITFFVHPSKSHLIQEFVE